MTALSLVAGLLVGCSQVKVSYQAPDFDPATLIGVPISVVDNGGQSGPIATDLAQKLREPATRRTALAAWPGKMATSGPYRLIAELTSDEVAHYVEHDTDESTEYVYDEDGEVIDCYTVIDHYETMAITRRTLATTYRIEESATGRPLWIALGESSKKRRNIRRSGIRHPSPPPFPKEAPLMEIATRMNKEVAVKLSKLASKSAAKAKPAP